jgi:hypothetical protein
LNWKQVEDGSWKPPRKQSPSGKASRYDLARDLAGAVQGRAKDRADNPDYMDGFAK